MVSRGKTKKQGDTGDSRAHITLTPNRGVIKTVHIWWVMNLYCNVTFLSCVLRVKQCIDETSTININNVFNFLQLKCNSTSHTVLARCARCSVLQCSPSKWGEHRGQVLRLRAHQWGEFKQYPEKTDSLSSVTIAFISDIHLFTFSAHVFIITKQLIYVHRKSETVNAL